MRVTGAADPTVPVKDTLKGETFPEEAGAWGGRRIFFLREPDWAGNGIRKRNLSSGLCGKEDGNRCGHGAAPRKNVIRESSDPGDMIILLGGRTGRDGCGGAIRLFQGAYGKFH